MVSFSGVLRTLLLVNLVTSPGGVCTPSLFYSVLYSTFANLIISAVQVGSAFIPAVPLTLLILLCPESPRWYIKKRRYRDAFNSLLRLRNHPIQAARDLYAIHTQVEIELEAIGDTTYIKRLVQLFTIPRVRRATLASFVVMIGQQMCGSFICTSG